MKHGPARPPPKDWAKAVEALSLVVGGLEQAIEKNRSDLHTQFTRIAQIQVEIDHLKAAVERLRDE